VNRRIHSRAIGEIGVIGGFLLATLFLACPRTNDTEAPTVKFLSPLNDDSLAAGAITLTTEAHDNIEVTNVEFYRNGTLLDTSGLSLSDTFAISWDAQSETLGNSYSLRAVALDRTCNTGSDSVFVHFRKVIPPGTLSAGSFPAGAAIWIDSVNTGQVTPATIESLAPGTHFVRLALAHYQDLDTVVNINGGQTTQLDATLSGFAVVNGTVTWSGHSLSSHCYVLLDSSHDGHGAYIAMTIANPTNGAFTINCRMSPPDSAYVLGFDDVDGNGYPNSGDGQGFWDVNGDQQMTVADMLRVAPGDTINNAQVVLHLVP